MTYGLVDEVPQKEVDVTKKKEKHQSKSFFSLFHLFNMFSILSQNLIRRIIQISSSSVRLDAQVNNLNGVCVCVSDLHPGL